MALLSSYVGPICVGTICIIILLCMCNSVHAQQIAPKGIKNDSAILSLPVFPSKDSIRLQPDSLLKKKILAQPKAFVKEVKNSKKQLSKLLHSSHGKGTDTLPSVKNRIQSNTSNVSKKISADSIKSKTDTVVKHLVASERNSFSTKIKSTKEAFLGIFALPKKKEADSTYSSNNYKSPHLLSKPLIGFGGGYITYNYNYRSSIDTPFAENNIGQHNITGSLQTVIAKALPFRINFWIRRSNSVLYQNITDIQVSFDAVGFRNQLVNNIQRRLIAFTPSANDSLLEKLTSLKSAELFNTHNWLMAPVNIQRIHESQELVQIDETHLESRPADSSERQKRELVVKAARAYILLFDSTRLKYDSLTGNVDSLKQMLTKQRRKLERYRQIVNGKFTDWASYSQWKDELNKNNPGGLAVPDRYKWLLGVRNFSVGKTPVNYSELTAKNISLTGINFEYNSWYYLAIAAGLIDYRFRDFQVGQAKPSRQYMYMLRAGLGKIQKNYFIVSFFQGQKQLYSLPTNSQISNTISITGVTAETKWQLTNHTYVIAEAGQSMSPDYRSTPPSQTGKFTFNGNTNKALSIKMYSVFPQLGARAEGMYKYTGANYQSFSSFQTNAAVKSWYVKWEQNFFKRKLRITGSLRSNEFTNPYIIQNYKSNTVFKSINAVFKARKWPVISIGYMPMSQLSVVGQQVVENRFQTLTASVNHFYKIGNRQAFTLFVFNKFYNTNTDSGFIYFNAANYYLTQNVVFKLFTAGLGISDSKSNQYNLTAAELSLRIPVLRKTILGIGVKINNLNQMETKIGGRFNIEMAVTKKDRITVNFEKGYLPGNGKTLVKNDMGNIQYSRYF